MFLLFNYNSIQEIKSKVEKYALNLEFSDNTGVLNEKVNIGSYIIPNRIVIHPMEGCDGNEDGSPGELTIRRYERFAEGGVGLLWFEAVAVVPEGRANPRQLWINDKNLTEFQKLYKRTIECAYNKNKMIPVCIMQLTHSGRFSKPNGKSAPILECHNPYLDKHQGLDDSLTIISDEELEKLEDKYVEAAILAKQAGFQGVDVKACHRYLNSGLLSAFTRKGKYGETFEGRTRFIINVIDKIRDKVGKDFIVTTRLNIYDGIPYPYGWGVNRDDHTKYDLAEPIKLVKILYEKGVRIINLTMGCPYYNPHINRPYDKGGYVPQEDPIQGVVRLNEGIGEIQKAVPDMAVIGTGYTWLRQFSVNVAAADVENKNITLVGYGRQAFAYPDLANDIIASGTLNKDKCCITCGKCTEIMRAGGTTGCVVRDVKVYGPIYKEYCK